jgi:stage II sporulation protein D
MADKKHRKNSLRSTARLLIRLGVGLVLLALIWSCASIPGLREESTSTYIRVPFVRVLLEENISQIFVGADDAFAIECLKQGKQTIYYSGQAVRVESTNRNLTVRDHRNNVIESSLDEVNIIPRGTGNRVNLGKKRYRGILKILPHGETLRLVNVIYMEDYLRGVVPPEIGLRTDSEFEAVKAQAVAARTYAMAHLKQYRGEAFDMKSSVIDQVYEGAKVEERLINRAIDATTGQVLMYQDEFLDAYYHSTCGGVTDNIADVWDRKETPYLKSVQDGDACSWSKYYTWKESFTEEQLRGRIEQYLSRDRGRDLRIGTIVDITVEQHTAGGRVGRMVIRTDKSSYDLYKDRIRWAVGRASNPELILPSSRFSIKIDRDSRGNIREITFEGRGYGHGVGMCQCGAIGRAREGWQFAQILQHYYTDAEVKRLY